MTDPDSGGTVLAGRYRLEERIGVGAMGEVWRSRDLRLQRDVAVKRVRLDGHIDAAAQARFRREAIAMAGVSHPNVVSVYDSGTDGDDGRTAYLVMELLDGPSCADLITSTRSLSLGEVERIGAGVARGLAAAHAAGVVHRDIKPGNVVVSRGEPKIVDFGIARLEQEATTALTAPQSTIGTAAYMSPEQAMGKPVGPASDVYSLGALLIALATGSPPFGAANSLALMRAHIDDPAPSLADLRDDAPPQLVALIQGMLAKEPGERPTATDVARVLEGGEWAPAVPPTVVDRAESQAAGQQATRVYAPPAPAPVAPAPAPGRTDRSRARGGWWWAIAAALLITGLWLGADLLRDGDSGGESDGTPTTSVPTTDVATSPGATPTASESVVTPEATPTQEVTTDVVSPSPAPEETPTLEEAVAAVGSAIEAVADSEARDQLSRAWQPAASGLQGNNAVDRLREVQQEADDLLEEELLTAAERDRVSAAIEDVINRL